MHPGCYGFATLTGCTRPRTEIVVHETGFEPYNIIVAGQFQYALGEFVQQEGHSAAESVCGISSWWPFDQSQSVNDWFNECGYDQNLILTPDCLDHPFDYSPYGQTGSYGLRLVRTVID